MKKITVVMGTILAMYAIMVFPSYGQVINGCYQKNNGQLRILTNPGDACRPSEVAIQWNQKGDKGEQGSKGDPGPGSRSYMSGLVSFVPLFKPCVHQGGSCVDKSLVSIHLVDGQAVALDMLPNACNCPWGALEEILHFEFKISKLLAPSGNAYNGYEVVIKAWKGDSPAPLYKKVSPSMPVYNTREDPFCATPGNCPLNMLVKLNSDSLLTLEVDPSDLKVMTSESQGAIYSAKIQYDVGAGEATGRTVLWNAGDFFTDYLFIVDECSPSKFEPVVAQSRTLNSGEAAELTFPLRASGPISATTNQCKVSLRAPSGKLYDSVIVLFDWPMTP